MLYRFKKTDLSSYKLSPEDLREVQTYEDPYQRQTCAILISAGLYHPIVNIRQSDHSYPRAYNVYPTLYANEDDVIFPKDEILIDVPNGYQNKGHSLRPTTPHDIVPEEETNKLLHSIHGGGWGPFCYVGYLPSHGTDLPTGYTRDETVTPLVTYSPQRIFIMDQSMRSRASDLILSIQRNDQAIRDYADAMRNYLQSHNPDSQIGMSYTPEQMTPLRLSFHTGSGNKDVKCPDFIGFTRQDGSHYQIGYPTPKNGEAARITTLYNAIDRQAPDMSHIIIEKYGEASLVSVRPSATKIPDELFSLPTLSLATYQWLRCDREDISMGITLPPMPREVINELMPLNANHAPQSLKLKLR